MARRRKIKQKEVEALFWVAVVGGAIWLLVILVTATVKFVGEHATLFVSAAGIVVAVVVGFQIRKAQIRRKEELQAELERQELARRIAQARISDNRHDYIISNTDYRRGNPRENLYRKEHMLTLLHLFENRCAKCGSRDNGVDIDHFVFSKNEGGSFAMFHKDGFWVNNALPLCESCNRSKSDQSYKDFYTPEQLAELFEKNVEMTKRLNASESLQRLRPKLERDLEESLTQRYHGP